MNTGPDRLEARMAIEALRAGVPNRGAIRLLGSHADALGERFTRALDGAWGEPLGGAGGEPRAPGLLVAGDYGTGKSHLLGHLRELALSRGFVVSTVAVSKETPLSQPAAMHAAALRGATVAGRPEDAVAAALGDLVGRPGAVQGLEEWATGAGLSPVFPAIAYLLGRELAPELVWGIEAFLAGGKPPAQAVRARLAQLGARGMFALGGMKAAQLVLERPRFLAQLFRAAGFAGWVVLIDEVELIGRYGAVQRAGAYAELGRWLGLPPGETAPGIVVAAAIAEDFDRAVIQARQDDERVPERLRLRGLPRQADLADAALAAIRRAPVLSRPDEAELRRHAVVVQRCYALAYGWDAPPASLQPREARRTMRHHIRGWIIDWDMQRLYGATAGLAEHGEHYSYTEDATLDEAQLVARPDGDETGGE